jgi:signal transduction histidine kinase/FixJ family two-component response regulator
MLPANVLLVESESSMGAATARMLMDMGHGVRLFGSAEEGLEAFSKRTFDLVLANAHLPGLDGIEMLQRMRASEPTLATITVTSAGDHAAAVRAVKCGGRYLLEAPISAGELRDTLGEALRERQQSVEHQSLVGELFRVGSQLQETVVCQGRELSHTEGYLHNLLDAAPFSILSTDTEGKVLTYNRTAQRTYQYGEGEIVGRDASLLFGHSPEICQQERSNHLRKDGTAFTALVRRRDVLDSQDLAVAHLYVVEDLSERECLENQLLHAERLSALGQMAPCIAHEFRTPLQLITGYAELALDQLGDASVESGRDSVSSVLSAARELIELVAQLADLGKPRDSRFENVDLAEQIESVLRPMQNLGIVKHCEIVRAYSPQLGTIWGDRTQMDQLFRNLVHNAVQAMEGCSSKKLTLDLKTSSDGSHVECAIGDTGRGIDADSMEKIFLPFYTTKVPGKGTGLGMTIVKSILDRHEATVRVESEVGRGTWFYISFPAVT